jgi:hypothetical protein
MNKLTLLTCEARWPGGLQASPARFPPALLFLLGPPEAGRAARSLPASSRVGRPRKRRGRAFLLLCYADGWGPLSAASSTYDS